jgi:hypothetical protein
VSFVSFLSGGFTTMAVMNSLERKLAKRTSVQCNAAVVRRQRVEPQETAAGSTREPSKTLFKNEKNIGLGLEG